MKWTKQQQKRHNQNRNVRNKSNYFKIICMQLKYEINERCLIGPSNWFPVINSLVPGKFEWHFRYLIFQTISVINGWGISCELALLRWMLLDLTDDKSTLVQVMAWCHQATSHYLSQCWLRSLSPYGVTRPKWVNMCKKRYYISCLIN